jgi:hypothetical protein
MTLNGIIAHGRGDKTFIQYSNDFLPNDLNFTIGSLLRLFRSLKKESARESWVLFEFEPQNAFFQ